MYIFLFLLILKLYNIDIKNIIYIILYGLK